MQIILQWKDENYGEDGTKIYRSDTTIDTNSPPAPIGDVGSGIVTFTDNNVVEGNTYFYRVAAYFGSELYFSEEIQKLAESSLPELGMIHGYDFASISSGIVVDQIGAFDLTAYGGPSLRTESDGETTLAMDGVNDYLQSIVSTEGSVICRAFAVSVYLDNPIGTSPTNTLMSLMNDDVDKQHYFVLGDHTAAATSETITVGTRIASTLKRSYTRNTYAAGRRVFVFNFNESTLNWEIYVDDVLASMFLGINGGADAMTYGETIMFGKFPDNTWYLDGGLKRAALWDRALTRNEITQVYENL